MRRCASCCTRTRLGMRSSNTTGPPHCSANSGTSVSRQWHANWMPVSNASWPKRWTQEKNDERCEIFGDRSDRRDWRYTLQRFLEKGHAVRALVDKADERLPSTEPSSATGSLGDEN